MARRPIIIIPDPLLKTVSAPVERVDGRVRALMDDMAETMYAAPGIGLAAIQVGIPERLVVMDVSRDEEERQPLYLVNPQVVWTSEETSVYEEGCLSIPEYYEEVERPAECTVRYLDRDGAEREMQCTGLMSTCVQHEIDHLDGVLFIDHISRLKRDRVMRRFAKAKKQEGAA